MPTRVYVDGQISDERGAMVSVFDRGFLFGDSIYEVLRTAQGQPVDLEWHLERLAGSAARIAMALPPEDEIRRAIAATREAARDPESNIRIVVTRGVGPIGLDPALGDRPRLVVVCAPLVLPDPALYERGASLAIVSVQRTSRLAFDPACKSGNYLNNVMALAEARRKDAYEAILLNVDGEVAEGSTSNVFAVTGDRIVTPPLGAGILPGITRRRVLELATSDDLVVHEAPLGPDELRGADEVFLTSSIRGVLPIARVDQQERPAPGPVTRRLLARYRDFLASHGQGGEARAL